MNRLDGARNAAPEGVTQPRCVTCQRFARLLPGETACARCSGVLALEFSEILALICMHHVAPGCERSDVASHGISRR